MNKKFSTLVASILLASSVGAYAQGDANSAYAMVSAINFVAPATTAMGISEIVPASESLGGYVKGKAYFLKQAGGEYLYAKLNENGSTELLLGARDLASLSEVNSALWEVAEINAPVGPVAPQYVFVNKATRTVLSMDKSKAVALDKVSEGSNILSDGQTQWLSAPSYKNPVVANEPIYASIGNDNIIAFAKGAQTTASSGVYKVVLVSLKASDKATAPGLVTIMPYVTKTNGVSTKYALSANDLNTMLGAAGLTATSESFFQLSFAPTATMNGKDNLLAMDLQAVAVQQYELKYGSEEDDANSVATGKYASFYEKRDIAVSAANKISDIKKADLMAVNDTEDKWVTLRNRDGEYLVVDTAFVGGTVQDENPRITFAFDKKLYNAKDKDNSRYRDPRSYLFSFEYNPITGNVDIRSYAYAKDRVGTSSNLWVGGSNTNAPKTLENPESYKSDYDFIPMKSGKKFYPNETTNVTNAFVSRAALGATSEVTLASNGNVLPTGESYFKIKLGNSSAYQTTNIKSGAYLLKVTGSKQASRVGKYYVNNLKGGFEVIEQAVRQNFQEMPATQWVIKSAGTTNGSPITIKNREFEGAPSGNGILTGGIVYTAGVGNAFAMGTDTLEFIKVTAPMDEKLGYKYVANDTISESLFTFNYLHDLAMDKPINTKSDKDSVVWVDKDGNATKFMLEVVADDTYGTNNEVSGVSKNLTRRVYNVKVNDATKLQNDKRYLAYDNDSKKYKVSEGAGDLFFLKENNEADGTCYYTFVKANAVPVVKYNLTDNAYDRAGYVTFDGDANLTSNGGMYLATEGTYYDAIDGLDNHKGWAIKTYKKKEDADKACAAIGNRFAVVAKIAASQNLSDWTDPQVQISGLGADDTKFYGEYVVYLFSTLPSDYADYKVSVDNNTLDLVNGVLSNDNSQEVATSAFAVKRDADPLYRRFNTVEEGIASNAPDTVKFFRVNSSVKEYLYEDGNSAYSKDKGFNFLGVEGKGDVKNAAIYVDTAYVRGNTRMPQYMLALRPTFVEGKTILCDATTHSHATPEEALACPHTKITPTYVDATYLVNLQDSIDVNAAAVSAKYQWNKQYTRLGFVDARHIHDTLVIKNSIYTGINKPIQVGKAATWASKDSIFLGNNMHKNAVFSFRLVKSGSNDFLIESETEQYNEDKKVIENVKNADLKGVKIAPEFGGWVKIQNGVPVLANKMKYSEIGLDAEIFNVEATTERATSNEDINATEVSIEAGNGNVTIKNAEGKTVAISNILGQALVNTVITSDNATISVPAGIVVVSVEGEEAAKVIVK